MAFSYPKYPWGDVKRFSERIFRSVVETLNTKLKVSPPLKILKHGTSILITAPPQHKERWYRSLTQDQIDDWIEQGQIPAGQTPGMKCRSQFHCTAEMDENVPSAWMIWHDIDICTQDYHDNLRPVLVYFPRMKLICQLGEFTCDLDPDQIYRAAFNHEANRWEAEFTCSGGNVVDLIYLCPPPEPENLYNKCCLINGQRYRWSPDEEDGEDGFCIAFPTVDPVWVYCPTKDLNPPQCVMAPRIFEDFTCTGEPGDDSRDVYLLECCPACTCPSEQLVAQIEVTDPCQMKKKVVLLPVEDNPLDPNPGNETPGFFGEFCCTGTQIRLFWGMNIEEYDDPDCGIITAVYAEIAWCESGYANGEIKGWYKDCGDGGKVPIDRGLVVLTGWTGNYCFSLTPEAIASEVPCSIEEPFERSSRTYYYGVFATCDPESNKHISAVLYHLVPNQCRDPAKSPSACSFDPDTPPGPEDKIDDAATFDTFEACCGGIECHYKANFFGWGEGDTIKVTMSVFEGETEYSQDVPAMPLHSFCGCSCADITVDYACNSGWLSVPDCPHGCPQLKMCFLLGTP